ncbi:rRNA adenine N(6)-methyltransferase family protein [Actinocrispum sp. NPDC049592]|uniref:rRNA adenine N(6)-methyltransferase family protein n=1 Tax=Actinocrispum sp. NPDC049592 TaxID=3154835 RepID=UPI0034144784
MSRPNPSGVHFLCAPAVIRGLLRSADLGPGDLVIDFGAGPGTLTAPLASTGSRILAVERDDEFVRKLTRRFADRPQVRVIHADLRTVPLPNKEFSVVANIPYSLSTLLVRRLLAQRSFVAADLVVQWGFAKRVSDGQTKETALWARKFHIRVAGRIPASSFRPAPRVDSAHLVIRRR